MGFKYPAVALFVVRKSIGRDPGEEQKLTKACIFFGFLSHESVGFSNISTVNVAAQDGNKYFTSKPCRPSHPLIPLAK